MQWYLTALRKYATFRGRARRKEYWMFVLFNFFTLVVNFLDRVLGLVIAEDVGVLDTLYSLAVLIPSLAVTVRRLHDTNHRGWWVLAATVLLLLTVASGFSSDVAAGVFGLATIGLFLTMLYFLILDGEPGTNRYGPNPKQPDREIAESF